MGTWRGVLFRLKGTWRGVFMLIVIGGLQNFENVHFSADVHPICGKLQNWDGRAEHFPAGHGDEDENPRCGAKKWVKRQNSTSASL